MEPDSKTVVQMLSSVDMFAGGGGGHTVHRAYIGLIKNENNHTLQKGSTPGVHKMKGKWCLIGAYTDLYFRIYLVCNGHYLE